MPNGDIWQVANEFTYQGNANNYLWNLRVDQEADAQTVGLILLNFGAARQTAWLPLHNPSVSFKCVTARKIFPDTGLPQQLVNTEAGNRTCTPSLDHLPGQCSAVVTLFGDIGAPTGSNTGRDFITGQCCGDQLNGVFDSGVGSYLEELCEMYVAMGNTFAGGGNAFSIGIFSPKRAGIRTGPNVPPTPPYFWPLVMVRGKSLVRTQRRRQPLDPCEVYCENEVGAPVPP